MAIKVTDLPAKSTDFIDTDVFMVAKDVAGVPTSQQFTWEELKEEMGTSLGVIEISGTLTAAQINSLDTTPVELLPAQGANTIVIITGLTAVRKAGTAYTTVDDIIVRYSATTTAISTIMTNTGLIGTANYISANYNLSNDFVAANANSSVEFHCGSAISGGTGDIYYNVNYKVIDFN